MLEQSRVRIRVDSLDVGIQHGNDRRVVLGRGTDIECHRITPSSTGRLTTTETTMSA